MTDVRCDVRSMTTVRVHVVYSTFRIPNSSFLFASFSSFSSRSELLRKSSKPQRATSVKINQSDHFRTLFARSREVQCGCVCVFRTLFLVLDHRSTKKHRQKQFYFCQACSQFIFNPNQNHFLFYELLRNPQQ